jgi:hypothetical protein
MDETITMAGVLYVPVDDQGEPYRWGPQDEVVISAFGDFCLERVAEPGEQGQGHTSPRSGGSAGALAWPLERRDRSRLPS